MQFILEADLHCSVLAHQFSFGTREPGGHENKGFHGSLEVLGYHDEIPRINEVNKDTKKLYERREEFC